MIRSEVRRQNVCSFDFYWRVLHLNQHTSSLSLSTSLSPYLSSTLPLLRFGCLIPLIDETHTRMHHSTLLHEAPLFPLHSLLLNMKSSSPSACSLALTPCAWCLPSLCLLLYHLSSECQALRPLCVSAHKYVLLLRHWAMWILTQGSRRSPLCRSMHLQTWVREIRSSQINQKQKWDRKQEDFEVSQVSSSQEKCSEIITDQLR